MGDETIEEDRCLCGYDGEWTACLDGTVYGPCVSEFCNGACEMDGDCVCDCHKQSRVKRSYR